MPKEARQKHAELTGLDHGIILDFGALGPHLEAYPGPWLEEMFGHVLEKPKKIPYNSTATILECPRKQDRNMPSS